MTRAGCSLCAAAEPVVERAAAEAGVRFDRRDVDDPSVCDAGERSRWTDKVPVVLLDGAEHTWWTVDEPALRAALRGRRR